MCYPIVDETLDNDTNYNEISENTHVNNTNENIHVNNTDQNDIVKLIELANKYKTQTQLQRQRAYDYYLKVKDTSDYKEKVKLRKHEYYINNKEVLKQKERFRYHNNVDYHDRVRARAKALYQKKQLIYQNRKEVENLRQKMKMMMK